MRHMYSAAGPITESSAAMIRASSRSSSFTFSISMPAHALRGRAAICMRLPRICAALPVVCQRVNISSGWIARAAAPSFHFFTSSRDVLQVDQGVLRAANPVYDIRVEPNCPPYALLECGKHPFMFVVGQSVDDGGQRALGVPHDVVESISPVEPAGVHELIIIRQLA